MPHVCWGIPTRASHVTAPEAMSPGRPTTQPQAVGASGRASETSLRRSGALAAGSIGG